MSELAIEAEALYKSARTGSERIDILQGVSLLLSTGRSLAITGPSGAGKSTLLGLLAGLDVPDSGRISLAGECITDMDEDQRAALRARQVGFVFQNFQLLPLLTAEENVMMPLELAGIPEAARRARDYLSQVGLGNRRRHYPAQLSGGEQQRVALARAFAGRPQILFVDEPTGNLDAVTGGRIVELLFRLNADQGTTLVLVTHDLQLAQCCHQQTELFAGRIR